MSRVSGLMSKKSSVEPILSSKSAPRQQIRTSRFEQDKRKELRSPSDKSQHSRISKQSHAERERESNDLINSAYNGRQRGSYHRLNEDIHDYTQERGISATHGENLVNSLLSKRSFDRFDPKADLKDMISEKLKSRKNEATSKSQERSFDRYKKESLKENERPMKSPRGSMNNSYSRQRSFPT